MLFIDRLSVMLVYEIKKHQFKLTSAITVSILTSFSPTIAHHVICSNSLDPTVD